MSHFTTIAKLRERKSPSGAVLVYDDKVFLIGRCLTGGYTADVYELVDDPADFDDEIEECRIQFLFGCDDDTFLDSGHAVAWCIQQIGRN